MYMSTLLMLSGVFTLLSIAGFIYGLWLSFGKDEILSLTHRVWGLFILIVLIFGHLGLYQLRNIGCDIPFTPYSTVYTPIHKNGDVKYYIYNDKVCNVDNYVDDKNFKVEILFYKEIVTSLGIIRNPPQPFVINYVPINKVETVETK